MIYIVGYAPISTFGGGRHVGVDDSAKRLKSNDLHRCRADRENQHFPNMAVTTRTPDSEVLAARSLTFAECSLTWNRLFTFGGSRYDDTLRLSRKCLALDGLKDES